MFLLNIILAFFIAGSFIALLTLLAERFGSTIGGLIANLPSNILITMIFISLTRGTLVSLILAVVWVKYVLHRAIFINFSKS